MRRIKNPIILFLAGIGFCAVVYGGWYYYQTNMVRRPVRSPVSRFITSESSSSV